MSEKQLNIRITQKIDTTANWAKATNFVPKKGELIVYSDGGGTGVPKFKVGDGTTTVGELEFSAAAHADKATDLDKGIFVQFGNATAIRTSDGTIDFSSLYLLTTEEDYTKVVRMPSIVMSPTDPGDDVDLWVDTSGSGDGTVSLGSVFNGASAVAGGIKGLVPAPSAGQQDYVLKGNGNWEKMETASATATTATFSAGAWGSAVPHTQTISVEGITTSSNVIIDVNLTGQSSDNVSSILEGWGNVNDVQTGAGTLTAYCYGDAPTVDLPVNILDIK